MTDQSSNSEYEQLLIDKRNLNRQLAEINEKIAGLELHADTYELPFDIQLSKSLKFDKQYAYSYDLKKQCYIYLDDSVVQITGFSVDEFKDLNIDRFFARVHPEDLPDLLKVKEKAFANLENEDQQFYDLKFRFQTAAGDYTPIHEWGVILFDSEGEPAFLHGVMHDLSDFQKISVHCDLIVNLVDKFSDPAFLHDFSGRIIYANKTAQTKLCYSANDFKNFNIWDINRLVPHHLWSILWDSIKEKGALTFETEYRTKQGDIIPTDATVSYISRDGMQYAFVVAKDITLRDQTKRALIASREQYKLIVDNQKELVIKLDSRLNCVFVSPSVSQMLGISESKILGKKLAFEKHPDDNAKFIKTQFEKVYVGDFESYQEFRIKTVKGWRWFAWSHKAVLDNQNNVKEIISVGRDITDKKTAELELNINRRRYEIAVDAGHIIVWEYDLPNDKVFIDQGLNPVFNLPTQFIKTKEQWLDIVHPEDRELLNICLRQLINESKQRVYCEIRSVNEAGEIIWLVVRAVGIKNKAGEIERIVGTASSIDRLKKVEAELSDRLTNEEIVAQASKFLVTDFSFESICSVVKLLAASTNATRVTIFENINSPAGLLFKPFEITGKVITSKPTILAHKSYKYVPDYFELMKKLSRLVSSELVGNEYETFELLIDNDSERGYFFPLFVGGQWWGFIAFFFDVKETQNSQNCFTTCQVVTEMISSFLYRRQAQEALKKAHRALEQRVEQRTKDLTIANDKLKTQAIEQARIAQQLADSQVKLKHLNQKLLESSEDARRKISAELHDSVAQDLVVLQLMMKNILRNCCKDEPCLEQPTEICTNIIHEIRSICQGLYPPALETLGLNKALVNLGKFYQGTGMTVHMNWSYKSSSVRFKPSFEIAIFRIVQEAMSNAMRHGKANEINVNIHSDDDNMLVEIINDGEKFDKDKLVNQGLGMQTMNNRADAIGGKLTIANIDAGTKVTVTIPESSIEILDYPNTEI